jgi:hypothetical protein
MLCRPRFSFPKNFFAKTAAPQDKHVNPALQAFHQFTNKPFEAYALRLRFQSQVNVRPIIENARFGERTKNDYSLAGNQFVQGQSQTPLCFFQNIQSALPAFGITFLEQSHIPKMRSARAPSKRDFNQYTVRDEARNL